LNQPNPTKRKKSSDNEGQVKRDLLKSAVRLLSADGRKGATARAICAEVGVGAPAMYHHYGDLAGLHKAAIDETFRKVAATYRQSTKTTGPLQGIRDSWALFMHIAHEEPRICRIVIEHILAGEIPRAIESNLRYIAKDLANLKAQGTLRYSPEFAAQLLWVAAIGSICVTATERKDGDAASPAIQESMVDVILNSLFTKPVVPAKPVKNSK